MNDSFKKGLDSIKAETPVSVKADPVFLLYGIIFVVLGFWMIDAGRTILGLFTIIVGLIGALGGCATFFWKSPKVKLIQAVDSFALAVLLAWFAIQDSDSLLLNFAMAGFMVWVGFGELKEYRRLKQIEQKRINIK